MTRRQTPNTRRTNTRKPSEATGVEGETIEEAKRALEEASSHSEPLSETTPHKTTSANETPASTSVNSELEAKVNDLKTSLDQSQQKEQALQQKVETLQAQLHEQSSLAQKLQTSLDKATKIQTELEQAQKAALQLAESNQTLIDENKALKKAQHQQAESSKKAAQLSVKPEPAPSSSTDLPGDRERFQRQQAVALAHPVFPNDPMPNRLSEQDIGWFD